MEVHDWVEGKTIGDRAPDYLIEFSALHVPQATLTLLLTGDLEVELNEAHAGDPLLCQR